MTVLLVTAEVQKIIGTTPDGKLGPKTRAAAKEFLKAQGYPAKVWINWSVARKWVAVQQVVMKNLGIDVGAVDGLIGPQTRYAIEKWQDITRDVPPVSLPSTGKVKWPKHANSSMVSFYGNRGTNLVTLQCPYPLRLAWQTSTVVRSFKIHKKCHGSALKVLQKVLLVYGLDEIKRLRLDLWGGCFNNRAVRGGTKWSTHAWGAAIDWDPDRNQLRWGRDKASFAKSAYDEWWKAWEDEGWVSLGRKRNYDWMHVQAAQL
jgi:hypothetical protein